MPVLKDFKSDAGAVPVKIYTNDIEDAALEQLEKLSRMPFLYKHLTAMPDVHSGKGSTIGSVITTNGAVIPAAVGVDRLRDDGMSVKS